MSSIIPIVVIVIAAVLAFAAGLVLARRMGYTKSREVVARCHRGHLFTTVWAAQASVHRLDLGWGRVQRCPVGGHLTLVRPVDQSRLTPEQKREARRYRDAAAG